MSTISGTSLAATESESIALIHASRSRATVYAEKLAKSSVRTATDTATSTLFRNAAGKRSTDFGRYVT